MTKPKKPSANQPPHIEIKGDRNIIIAGDAADLTAIPGDSNTLGAKSAMPPSRLARDKVSVARLPITGPDLFGRDAELQLLDNAWANPNINIVTFIASGGTGKSEMIERMGYHRRDKEVNELAQQLG